MSNMKNRHVVIVIVLAVIVCVIVPYMLPFAVSHRHNLDIINVQIALVQTFLGLLGIIVAVLAFWGYQFFKDSIKYELEKESTNQLMRVSKELDEKIEKVEKEYRGDMCKTMKHVNFIYDELKTQGQTKTSRN